MKADRRAELVDQGSQLFVIACHESGISVSKTRPTNDEELKHRAYSERFDEEMGWFK